MAVTPPGPNLEITLGATENNRENHTQPANDASSFAVKRAKYKDAVAALNKGVETPKPVSISADEKAAKSVKILAGKFSSEQTKTAVVETKARETKHTDNLAVDESRDALSDFNYDDAFKLPDKASVLSDDLPLPGNKPISVKDVMKGGFTFANFNTGDSDFSLPKVWEDDGPSSFEIESDNGLALTNSKATPVHLFDNVAEVDDSSILRGSAPRSFQSGCVYQEAHAKELSSHGVTKVVSFNEHKNPRGEENLLENGMSFKHYPTRDWHAPTREDLISATMDVVSNKEGKTYIHCGAGKGRTGTVVTAVQILTGKITDREQLETIMERNKVETDEQEDTLRALLDDVLAKKVDLVTADLVTKD